MGKKDREKAASVRSARKWLEQAEQSFDDDSHIKGELNLMLAEAEMKNLRKNHGAKRQKVLRFSALATALLLAGCAFFFLGHGTVPVPAQAAVEQTGSGTYQYGCRCCTGRTSASARRPKESASDCKRSGTGSTGLDR